MRAMIKMYTELKVGDIVFDYGANQEISKINPPEEWWSISGRKRAYWQIDQLEYKSGYLSCGCPVCLPGKRATKEEVIEYWKSIEEFASQWWGDFPDKMNRIKAAKLGLDICDDNGFLLSDTEVQRQLNEYNQRINYE